jgi:nucleoid DNA-binding protein
MTAKKKTAKTAAKAVKKPAAKKAVATTKKAASAVHKAGPQLKTVAKAYTKGQILDYLADQAGISKKQASQTFEALGGLIGAHVKSKDGIFTFPGLFKCVVVTKPATKARKGINPFNGQPIMFKAKPAHKAVKIRALKALKDMVK